MAITETLENIGKHFNVFNDKLGEFSGNEEQNVDDFIFDFRSNCAYFGYIKAAEKKHYLISKLNGNAKIWVRLQKDDSSCEELINGLKLTFGNSEFKLHSKTADICSLKQSSNESFVQYVLSVRNKARILDISEKLLVNICINGAKPYLKPYILSVNPQSFEELMKIPMVRDEELVQTEDVLVAKIKQEIGQLKKSMANIADYQVRDPDIRTTKENSREQTDTWTKSRRAQGGESNFRYFNACNIWGNHANDCCKRNNFAGFCHSRSAKRHKWQPKRLNYYHKRYDDARYDNYRGYGRYNSAYMNTYHSNMRDQYFDDTYSHNYRKGSYKSE